MLFSLCRLFFIGELILYYRLTHYLPVLEMLLSTNFCAVAFLMHLFMEIFKFTMVQVLLKPLLKTSTSRDFRFE